MSEKRDGGTPSPPKTNSRVVSPTTKHTTTDTAAIKKLPATTATPLAITRKSDKGEKPFAAPRTTTVLLDLKSNTIANTYRNVGIHPPPSCTTANTPTAATTSTVVKSEVKKFDELASYWWNDTNGWMTPLHRYIPLRLGFLSYAMSIAHSTTTNPANSDVSCWTQQKHNMPSRLARGWSPSSSSVFICNELYSNIRQRVIRTRKIMESARFIKMALRTQCSDEQQQKGQNSGNRMMDGAFGCKSGILGQFCKKLYNSNTNNGTSATAAERLLKGRRSSNHDFDRPSSCEGCYESQAQNICKFCQNLLKHYLQILPMQHSGMQHSGMQQSTFKNGAVVTRNSKAAATTPGTNTQRSASQPQPLAVFLQHAAGGQQQHAAGGQQQQLSVLDVGCGGGLISEAIARFSDVGAVIGVDASHDSIRAARFHAASSLPEYMAMKIKYYACPLENLDAEQEVQRRFKEAFDNPQDAKSNSPADALRASTATAAINNVSGCKVGGRSGGCFDAVIASEVIEHVADPQRLMDEAARQVKTNGVVVVTTIAKSWLGWAVAIIGAENVFGLAPKGTHEYSMLVAPEELKRMALKSGLTPLVAQGTFYIPLTKQWIPIPLKRITYMAAFTKK